MKLTVLEAAIDALTLQPLPKQPAASCLKRRKDYTGELK